MKTFFKSRIAAVVVVIAMAFATVQCGYILHPEREGNEGGTDDIDVPVLIMDCAWLLVGIIPGVIALGVDFYTGCIYETGSQAKVEAGDQLGLRLRGEAPLEATVSVTMESKAGDYQTTLFQESVDRGHENDKPYVFTVPENVEEGQYQVSINVNGVTNAAWPLQVN